MRVNRRGITRTVLLAGPWVVKMPSLRPYGNGLRGVLWSLCRGVLANQSEAEWSRCEDEPVCPVRWSLLGGVINVYPRCEPAPDIRGEDGRYTGPVPESAFPFGDTKADNLGLLAGRLVWVDYDLSYNGCQHDMSGAGL